VVPDWAPITESGGHQLHAETHFDPMVLTAMGEKIYAAAKRSGRTGIQFVPLDEYQGSSSSRATTGHLSQHGKMIIDADPMDI
jgi:hypothetical protein